MFELDGVVTFVLLFSGVFSSALLQPNIPSTSMAAAAAMSSRFMFDIPPEYKEHPGMRILP